MPLDDFGLAAADVMVAPASAIRMSQARASSQPPPSANPETPAINGVRQLATRFQKTDVG